jgi:hypothetical protein
MSKKMMPLTEESLSERALAMVIRCRIASGQPAMDAIKDVLGADKVDAMCAAINARLRRSKRSGRRTP